MRLLPVWISVLIFFTAPGILHSQCTEETYFQTRDRFILQFKKADTSVDDHPALAKLEKQIIKIVGPVEIKGFTGRGKINLLTLRNKPGFGRVDGLRFNSHRETLFVTTKNLLNHYLAGHSGLPKNYKALSKCGDFYRRVFYSDAGVTYYAEVPIIATRGQSCVHAFLGLTSQDIGPLIPNDIFVFVATEKRIFIVCSKPAAGITDIPECRRKWDKFNQKSLKALKIYQSSQLKDKNAINNALQYEEQGFMSYHRCFGREARDQPFFEPLIKQAQSIADRLPGKKPLTKNRCTQN